MWIRRGQLFTGPAGGCVCRAGPADLIRGATTRIAHIGYPTGAFTAPLIDNPWFEQAGIDAAVVPMGVTPEDDPQIPQSPGFGP
ncbi:MAG: hypothetical protein B7X59_07910 [Polaromonas sp. 39-63-203]|nr:MAG: hypothetical protein B7Y54_07885 [Polaromonas sp. 35-63-240]OYY94099.1 MAG: hypothetical protein B7Y42_11450 [Polaromonas sp. 28-63-22]OYZ83571.1 MAG: hypothetical protein B7Y03_08470 [Polaromonas sp. 24-62-144]OZA97438.1 MAG: hypothetical protein B7X59_07910 [Polaromonas sp. 39-63-203]